MAEPDTTPYNTRKRPVAPRVWRPLFLAALANSANVRAACQAAGVDRTAAYNARERSAEFRAAWDRALEDACDVLEAVARQRALAGLSDTLIIFLLKSHRPAVYRETIHHKIDIQQLVRQAAEQRGIDPDEAIRAAEAIVRQF